MKKFYTKFVAVVSAFCAALVLKAAPAAATLDTDVDGLFTTGTAGLATLQTNYLAILGLFIGLAVLSLAFIAVVRGIKKGRAAI